MKGDPTVGGRYTIDYPGHPDHGQTGTVVKMKRQTRDYFRRAFMRLDTGEYTYVTPDHLRAIL